MVSALGRPRRQIGGVIVCGFGWTYRGLKNPQLFITQMRLLNCALLTRGICRGGFAGVFTPRRQITRKGIHPPGGVNRRGVKFYNVVRVIFNYPLGATLPGHYWLSRSPSLIINTEGVQIWPPPMYWQH